MKVGISEGVVVGFFVRRRLPAVAGGWRRRLMVGQLSAASSSVLTRTTSMLYSQRAAHAFGGH
jgi:hypothetical protein